MQPVKVLITGAGGFIGNVLAQYCSKAGSHVLGLDIKDSPNASYGAFELCDIRDADQLFHLIDVFRPDRVFHLAAQSYPTLSLVKPRETIESNVVGTVNLFESLRQVGIMPVVVVACSSAEYGPVAGCDLPTREGHPLRPLHPYGVSKVAQDLLAAQYFLNYAIPCVRIRIFNTTGPGKLGDVCSDLVKRAVEIELGIRAPRLIAGNLATRRALVDVRDMVRALWMSADHCEYGEVYNVGGADVYSAQDVIEFIRERVKISFSVEQDPELIRACDEPVIAGDISKFVKCTGWKPEIRFENTIADMLEWWRTRLSSAAMAPATAL
jgi:GDP-4-dehydro-6-deoxy-D-mannose reductase